MILFEFLFKVFLRFLSWMEKKVYFILILVHAHWSKFIDKVDHLIETSLRAAVRKSLLDISKAINGDVKGKETSSTDVPPLFKLDVVLESQKVEFNPTLQTLEEEVNRTAR